MNIRANDFPGVYEALGVTTYGRGCVMVKLPALEIRQHVSNFSEDDVFYTDDPDRKWLGGIKGEQESHFTLLYGLMEKATTWSDAVGAALDGWEPEPITIKSVTSFDPTVTGLDYAVIVAELEKNANLLEGRHRLQLLPHIETFPGDWRAHVTLAYVKNERANVDWAHTTKEKWIRSLKEAYEGKTIVPTGLELS